MNDLPPLQPDEYDVMVAKETAILEVTEEIAKVLEQDDLLKKDLADRVGVSAARISHIMSGESNLTLESLVRLADALDRKVEIRLVDKVPANGP